MLVVNLYGGPGAGKSTTATGVFSALKLAGLNAEYVSEFVKDLTWEERLCELNNQIYVFGNQLQRLKRMEGKVDVVVTDSPIMLATIYGKSSDTFKKLVFEEHIKFDNMNFFIQRVKKFNPNGRAQNEGQALMKCKDIEKMLWKNDMPFTYVTGDKVGIETCTRYVLKKLENKCCLFI